MLTRGSSNSPVVFTLLRDAATRLSIPYTVHAAGGASWTDADAIHVALEGIATGLLSNPNRYNGTLLVGAGDGKLYQLGNLLVNDPALLDVKSLTLGDPATPGYVGDTTIDRATGMIYVGTGSGAVYAVTYPLP